MGSYGQRNMKMLGADETLTFPDFGKFQDIDCQYPECLVLDFLPFPCPGCRKVFCMEHSTYETHNCPQSELKGKNRKVIICETCSTSIETTGYVGEDEKAILEKHAKSKDCDPSKKKKPRCGVRRCGESLTFVNTTICKTCDLKVCLKHRFPADHECKKQKVSPAVSGNSEFASKFLAAFAARNGKDCSNNNRKSVSPTSSSRSIDVC